MLCGPPARPRVLQLPKALSAQHSSSTGSMQYKHALGGSSSSCAMHLQQSRSCTVRHALSSRSSSSCKGPPLPSSSSSLAASHQQQHHQCHPAAAAGAVARPPQQQCSASTSSRSQRLAPVAATFASPAGGDDELFAKSPQVSRLGYASQCCVCREVGCDPHVCWQESNLGC